MKKKGFTLVELLAVIAILAILVIIALPNVMGMFNTAKKNSFTTEIKEVYKQAQQQWISDSMMSTSEITYYRTYNGTVNESEGSSTGKGIDLTGRTQLDYLITINKAGKITKYYATDGSYQYFYDYATSNKYLEVEDIGKNATGDNAVEQVSELTGNTKVCIGHYDQEGIIAAHNNSETNSCYQDES